MGVLQALLDTATFRWSVVLGVILGILYLVYNSHTAGLGHIPGPFIARYTNLHAFVSTWRAGRHGDYLPGIHEKYGDVVRVGPRTVSVADPEAINTIYNSKLRLHKFKSVEIGKPAGRLSNIATMRDPQVHGQYRKPIANAYSLSTIVEYEPRVNDTLEVLYQKLDRESAGGAQIDLARWAFYYASDVIGELSFGKPIGFLEQGRDVYNLIKKQVIMTDYVRLLMVMPILHYFLLGNPILSLITDLSKNEFYRFSQKRVQERIQEVDSPREKSDRESPRKPDLLAYFLDAREKYPDIMTEEQVISTVIVNVFAGSLATSTLYLVIHHLVSNPSSQDRLYNDMKRLGVSSPVTWHETQKLPFLNGLIRESTRLHLALNSMLGRDVPPEGMVLPSGVRLPPGTEVGIKPHCSAAQERSFGERPLEFIPSRWCKYENESEEVYQARKLRMERADLSFGYGTRACIGQNIARLQMFKLIANLVWRYEFVPAENIGSEEKREVFCYLKPRSAL